MIRRAQEMQRAALASATSVVRPTITVVRDEPAVPRAAGESVRRLYGARETGTGVLFCQPLALGDEVDVVGEFNNWTPGVNRMRPNGMLGVHELRLALSPGQHRYKLIVDGRWITDPYNSETVSAEASGDGCGGSHSVVRVARTPVPA